MSTITNDPEEWLSATERSVTSVTAQYPGRYKSLHEREVSQAYQNLRDQLAVLRTKPQVRGTFKKSLDKGGVAARPLGRNNEEVDFGFDFDSGFDSGSDFGKGVGNPTENFLPPGSNPRALGTNPRALGTNPRALGVNPRALGTNPCALEVNPRALGVNPRALGVNPRALQGSWITRKGRHSPGPDSAVGLSLYFKDQAVRYDPLSRTSTGALANCFKQDLVAGLEPDVIRRSIDRLFVGRPNKRIPLWKQYLSRRLMFIAQAQSPERGMEEHRYDKEHYSWGIKK